MYPGHFVRGDLRGEERVDARVLIPIASALAQNLALFLRPALGSFRGTTMIRKTMVGSFVATDGQGQRHRIYVYTAFDDEHRVGAMQVVRKLQLSDGREVVQVGDGEYETADKQVRLHCADSGL